MIKVVLHRVLIKRDIPEDTDAVKTKKEVERIGLAMPSSYKEELEKAAKRENASMDRGIVLDIGETAFTDYGVVSPIKVGDYITYARHSGKDVIDPDDNETYVIINDEDVIAILTKKEPLDG